MNEEQARGELHRLEQRFAEIDAAMTDARQAEDFARWGELRVEAEDVLRQKRELEQQRTPEQATAAAAEGYQRYRALLRSWGHSDQEIAEWTTVSPAVRRVLAEQSLLQRRTALRQSRPMLVRRILGSDRPAASARRTRAAPAPARPRPSSGDDPDDLPRVSRLLRALARPLRGAR